MSSTSSGAMPGASVMTVTVGAVRSKKMSTGMRVTHHDPRTSKRPAATRTAVRCRRAKRMRRFSMIVSPRLVNVAFGRTGAQQGGAANRGSAQRDDTRPLRDPLDEDALTLGGEHPHLLAREALAVELEVDHGHPAVVDHGGGGKHDSLPLVRQQDVGGDRHAGTQRRTGPRFD